MCSLSKRFPWHFLTTLHCCQAPHTEEKVPKFRDSNRATKAQGCTPLKDALWFGISQFPWAPVTTCWPQSPAWRVRGWSTSLQWGAMATLRNPSMTDTAKTRHKTTALHRPKLPVLSTLTRRLQSPGDGTGHHETTASTLHCAPYPDACRSLTSRTHG